MTELPFDVAIETMQRVSLVRVVQLRCACREWSKEEAKTIRTVALIDFDRGEARRMRPASHVPS